MDERDKTYDWASKLSQCAVTLDELKSNMKLDPGDIAYNPAEMTWQIGTDDKPITIVDEDTINAVYDQFNNAVGGYSHAEGVCTNATSTASSTSSSVGTATRNGTTAYGTFSWRIQEEQVHWQKQFDGSHYCSHCGRDALLGPDGTEFLSEYCPYCGKQLF